MQQRIPYISYLGLITVVAVITAFVLLHSSARAATGTSQNITISPSSTELSINPGDSIRRAFKVINSGDDDFVSRISVAPYHVIGVDYDPRFTRLPGTLDTTDWVSIATTGFTINPGDTKSIDYTISVPENTTPGGYYVVIFAETRPTGVASGSGIVPRNRVGNIFYITVSGPVKTGGSLLDDSLGRVVARKTVPLGVKIRNDGGLHFLSNTEILVKNLIGKEVYKASLDRYILPQTERRVTTDWNPSTPIGIYKVSRKADVAGKSQSLPDKWIVTMQPWFLGTIIILFILVLLYFVLRRRMKLSKHSVSR